MRKVRSLVSFFVGVAFLTAACAPAAQPTPTPAPSPTPRAVATPSPTPKPPKDKLKLPTVVSYELNLPTLVAFAKDFFGEENIEVEDFVIGSGGTTRAAVIAKEFDFGLFAFVHVPIARLAGSPWKAIAQTHDREIFSLVVRNQLKDQVKTVADLKGKKVGFTTPGAGAWAFAQVFVQQAGLVPEKDVELVSLGGDLTVHFTALQTGRVDALSAWEPTTTRAIDQGIGFALVPIFDPAVHRKVVGADKAAAMLLVTREEVIQAKPDLARRMVNAHKKGLDFIRANSAEAIADLLLKNAKTAEQFKGLDRPLAVKIIDRLKSGYGNGCLSKSGFEAENKLSVDFKLAKGPITYADFANTTWAGECP